MAKATKVGKVMSEFKAGTLRSGSKTGPKVTNPKQAVAIGLSEQRKLGKPTTSAPIKAPKLKAPSLAKRLKDVPL